MDHDRLFKELLTTFFFEFLDLFFPQMGTYLDRSHLEFLDKETFTDVTAGDRHEADIIAKVRYKDQEVFFLVHIEHQASAQRGFARRMFHYFARIEQKHGLPVYPIVLFSFDAPLRQEPSSYEVRFPDRLVLSFNFAVVQLNRLSWKDYLRNPNPLASAIMARMRIEPEDRPRVKVECLRLLATFRLNEAKMQLIWGFVESYLKLSGPEQQRFEQALDQIEPKEKEQVMQLPNTWIEKGIAQGEERRRQMILRQLSRKLGPLPELLQSSVNALSGDQLDDLAEALLDFQSLDDARQWLERHA